MEDMTLKNYQEYLEKVTAANKAAWETQTSYYGALFNRNNECFKDLTEAYTASLKEVGEAQTFNQAFESHLAFEEKVREDLTALHESNIKAWEGLMEELKTIYTPAEEDKPAKAPKAKKAA